MPKRGLKHSGAKALKAAEQHYWEAVSTPEQKCISWPEQKYISDAGNKAPELGPFLEALSLGGIVHRHFRAGTA